MKRFAILIAMLLTFSIASHSQDVETTKPTEDTEIVRRTAAIDIEGVIHDNVVISLKSISVDMFTGDPKVKVTITDNNGKKIYKKTFKNSNLYIFSDGHIQVGQPKFNKLIITKSETSDDYIGVIREKEGIW